MISCVLASFLYADIARLEESVVTGIGFEESIGESVKNVTVISKDEIEEKGYISIMEVLKKVPSLTISRSGGNRQAIDLRGQGAYANRSVAIMIDGIKINSLDDSHRVPDLEVININDVERIEVIPGGGAVLFGSGTRGGVINIITSKSTLKDKTKLGGSLKVGSHKLRQLRANVGSEVVDNLYLNINAQKLQKNGYRDGTSEDGNYFDGSLKYSFLEHSSLTFSSGYSKVKRVSPDNMLTKKQLDENRKQSPKTESSFMGKKYVYHLSDSEQRGKKYDLKYKYNTSNTLLEALGYYQDISFDTFEDKKHGLDFRGKYNFQQAYILGGYNFENIEGKRGTSNKVAKTSHSVFAIGKYDITDIFALSLGYRHEFADYDVQRFRGGKTLQDSSADENNDAFELVFNAKYSDEGNAYMKYERGFISPSPYNRTDKIMSGQRPKYIINNLNSEIYDTFEVGVRDMLFGQFVSLSAFYTKSQDEIQIVWDNSGPSHGPNSTMLWHWENLEETERYGIEAFFEQYLTDSLTLSQSLSFIKAEHTKGRKKGQDIAYVPDMKAVLSASYDPIEDLRFMLDYTYYGNSIDNAQVKAPSYGVVDLAVRYNINKNFSILAGAKNLLNEKYNNYQSSSMNRRTKAMVTKYDPADERNLFVEFSYKY